MPFFVGPGGHYAVVVLMVDVNDFRKEEKTEDEVLES